MTGNPTIRYNATSSWVLGSCVPLAKLAIKQPIFITMVLLAIALVGVLSYLNMGVELYPDISNPSVSVSVSFPGASPTDVETLVTKPLERSLATINGVSSISSTSMEGSSMVTVNFNVGYNIQQGSQDIRQALDAYERTLPTGANTPVMRRFDPNSSPFLTAALNISGNVTDVEVRQIVEQIIQPRLSQVPGVAAATVSGYPIQSIMVDLSASRMKALKVSASQVVSALKAQNVIMPSGTITDSSQTLPVRTSAAFQNLDEIGNIAVAQYGTRTVQLSDVAAIEARSQDATTLVRVNGQDAMMVQTQMQSGASVVQTAALVRQQLDSLSHDFPRLKFTITQDNSTFIRDSNRDVMLTLIIGALLAASIVFLFMRDVRNTLITVAGLPIIVLGTFAVISLLGYTLNIITLMALSLSIGLLIDDAIVVRENIFRHMEHGESAMEAADKGTGEIAFAVIAITLTVVAVFVPVAFTSGQIGRLFKEFGITVAVAVLISLFEAFTFAPLLTAYFAKSIKPKATTAGPNQRRSSRWAGTTAWYRRVLAWSLRHRLAVVGVALALFLASIWVLRSMPLTFFPATDQGQISISINLPPGTALTKTDQVARQVEQVVMAQPETQRISSRIGMGGTPYQGFVSVQLNGGANTDAVITRLRKSLAQYGGQVSYSKPNQFLGIGFGMGVIGGRPVQITVQGPVDVDTLDGAAHQIMDQMNTVAGLHDITESLPPRQPELDIVVDRQRCADAGVSAAALGSTISGLVQGATATQVEWQGQLTDVVVQLRDQDVSDASALMGLPVSGANGTLYPLSALATIQPGLGPTRLSRQNQQAMISVGANLEGRTQGDVTTDLQRVLKNVSLPAGVTWQFSGQMAQAQSAYASLLFALVLGLVFVYMVLASQFGSFIHPFTVMMALPLAAVGSIAAIVVTRTQLSVIAMIGMILMIGLATKNSILLVDFIIRYRKQGRPRTEAILEAGPVRLRPIMMTSLAIILGMVPTALAVGASGSFRSPMAVAVIGGTVTSTLLSLVVVPVAYTLIDDALVAVAGLFRRGRTVTVTAGLPSPAAEAIPVEDNGKPVDDDQNLNGKQRRWRRRFRNSGKHHDEATR